MNKHQICDYYNQPVSFFFFLFPLLPLGMAITSHLTLTLSVVSSSVTQTLCRPSFTSCLNLLCGLPLFFLPGSCFQRPLPNISTTSLLLMSKTVSALHL